MFKWLVAMVVALVAAAAPAQPREQAPGAGSARVALVIGNDSYSRVPALRNARADARAMAGALRDMGFDVILRMDLDDRALRGAVREFVGRLSGGSEAVFYFAGHGVQLGAANYLLPVNISADSEAQVRDDGLPLQRVLDDLTEQKVRFSVAIIDACRDNPFPRIAGRSIGTSRGLAPTSPATGQMVLYSAGSGQTALDRLGANDRDPNGLFTRVLLKQMQVPGVPVDQVLRRTRQEVVALAKGVGHEQVPALYDQSIGDFFFRPAAAAPQAAAAIPVPAPATSAEADAERQRLDAERRRQEALRVAVAPSTPPATPPGTTGIGLRLQGNFPHKDLRTAAIGDLVRDIAAASSGAVSFSILPVGSVAPAFAVTDAVARKALAAAWISPAILHGKNPAFGFLDGPMFGPEAADYAAWRNSPAVLQIASRLYASQGVVGLFCGVTSPHGDLWARKPIASVADLRGLKIRAIGLQAAVFQKAGGAPNPLPAGEIVPAMDRGLIDAAMYSDPASDQLLGLPEVAPVYMVGQLIGARGLDLVIHPDVWAAMGPTGQGAVAQACRENVGRMAATSGAASKDAVQSMKKAVKIYKLPDAVTRSLERAWSQTQAELAATSPELAELGGTLRGHASATARRPSLALYGL